MTKLDFHRFQVRRSNNVYEQSYCHCSVGATQESRSNCMSLDAYNSPQVELAAFER